MKIIKKFLLFAAIGFSVTAKAQQAEPFSFPGAQGGNFELKPDNPIVATLDSLDALKYFQSGETIKKDLFDNKYNFLPDFVPYYPDSVYYYRMQKLDVMSPIELSYNPYVRSFIDLYANRKKSTTSRVLGLAQMYFPIFEQQLDKYNLPLELKYLAIVESALNPKARSRVGAGGLWQFMYYTGKTYGLEQTSYVDDRNDPYKATVAACRHFKDLYNTFHDWLLVLAAYNSGSGNVSKAIRRSGGKMTFWEIMPYLPRETRDYVPAFIAVNYVMAYSKEHNIYPVMPRIVYHETDTVAVNQPVSFSILSEKLGISTDELDYLNPTYRQGFIPATPTSPYYLRLPQKYIGDFVNNEDALYAYFKLKGYDPTQYQEGESDYVVVTKKITHKVRRGENLASIARKYGCTATELRRWNHLRRSTVAKGQNLKVYSQVRQRVYRPKPSPDASPDNTEIAQQQAALNDTVQDDQTDDTEVQPTVNNEPEEEIVPAVTTVHVKPRYHVVKRGETLPKIASKYGVSTRSIMNWNHMRGSKLLAGQRLRVNAPTRTIQQNIAETKTQPETKRDTPVISNRKVPANTPMATQFHKVKKGETLSKIANKYNVDVRDLIAWNNLGKGAIFAGQKLVVSATEQPKTKTTPEKTPVPNNSKTEYYTVRPGDTLWSISQKFDGVTIEQLKEWNSMKDNSVKVGQKIKILLPNG